MFFIPTIFPTIFTTIKVHMSSFFSSKIFFASVNLVYKSKKIVCVPCTTQNSLSPHYFFYTVILSQAFSVSRVLHREVDIGAPFLQVLHPAGSQSVNLNVQKPEILQSKVCLSIFYPNFIQKRKKNGQCNQCAIKLDFSLERNFLTFTRKKFKFFQCSS